MSKSAESDVENGIRRSNKSLSVFISYSRADGAFVKDLVNWLREADCTIWQDISGLRGGQTWSRGIEKAIRECDVLVIVLSPASSVSEWVLKETLLAMQLNKQILPILFRETDIPVQLIDLQYVDFRGNRKEAKQKLIKAISASIDSPPVFNRKPFLGGRRDKLLVLSLLGIVILGTIAYVSLSSLRIGSPALERSENTSSASAIPASNSATSTPTGAASGLAYSLTVQKVFNGKKVGGLEEYTGAEMFGNGWQFKFNLTPEQNGYFYLLNAAPQDDGGTEWNVLFPTPKNNSGNSRVAGGQKQTFGWYFFDDKPGQEKLWLVWAEQPIAELETAAQEAAQTELIIKNPERLNAVTAFLQAHEKERIEVISNDTKKVTRLKGAAQTWAYLVKLRHDKY